jgi:uncharacterized protein (DUF488 family)
MLVSAATVHPGRSSLKLYTIGFTKKSAKTFFGLLEGSGAKRVVDVRLHNNTQLAGFSKRDDLAWFLRAICRMDYVEQPLLAPTEELLARGRKGAWAAYEKDFLALIRERRIEDEIARDVIADGVLLCSEHEPEHCHRRLVAEYLREHWGQVEIVHLV